MPSKKSVFVLLACAIMLLSSSAFAQSAEKVDIIFDIQPDLSVKQTTTFFFSSPISGNVNYSIAGGIRDVEVFADNEKIDYELADNTIIIFTNKFTTALTIKYTTSELVFTSDSVRHFFTELSFQQRTTISARLILPESYGIYQNSFRPDAEISSDGRRVILQWNIQAQSTFFSAKFVQLGQGADVILAIPVVLAGAVILLWLYFREKTKEEFMKGFRTDEQRTIEYLQQRRVALQSDLQKEFKFSRAKATRIVATLEQKGLVRKQRYGRTNRLEWGK